MKRIIGIVLAIMIVLSLTVPVLAAGELTSASVSGIDAPVAGKPLDYTASVGSSDYKLLAKNTGEFKNGITWYDSTDMKYVSTSHICIAGHVYSAEVHIVPAAGKTFSLDAVGFFNGIDTGVVAGNETEIAILYEFPPCTGGTSPAPKVVFTSGSKFEAGGTATVDQLATAQAVMDSGSIQADMYNAALEGNMTYQWMCSNGPGKSGQSVTWSADDVGREYFCRVAFFSDSACTQFVDFLDSVVFTVSGNQVVAEINPGGPYYATVNSPYRLPLRCNVSGVTFDTFRSSLPNGLSISSDGVISGTPTKAGFWFVTFVVYKNGEMIGDLGVEFYVEEASVEPPDITTKSLPEATAGEAYWVQLKSTDANAQYSVTYNPGKANDFEKTGLKLSAKGVISGTPTKAGTYGFCVCASNDGGEDYQVYTLTVKEAPTEETTEATTQATTEVTTEATTGETTEATTQETTEATTEEPTGETNPGKTKADKNKDANGGDDGDGGSNNLWLYVSIGLGVLVIALVVILLLLKFRKKQNG